nr:hypothetical protein GCM10020093_052350 [Planobispora longispora]
MCPESLRRNIGERPLPGVDHRRQVGAVRPADPGEHDRGGGVLQVGAGAVEPGRDLPGGQPEHRADLAGAQTVPQGQLQDLALLPAQLRQGLLHQGGQFALPGVVVALHDRQRRRALPALRALPVLGSAGRPGHALEPDERVQPGPQVPGVAQLVRAPLRGDQGVVHGLRRAVPVGQQRAGVVVETFGVGVEEDRGRLGVGTPECLRESLVVGSADGRPYGHGLFLPRDGFVHGPRPRPHTRRTSPVRRELSWYAHPA